MSGYNLDSLLPEHGFDVARALVGSESTLVTVLHAELRLVPVPAAQALVVLGYPDIASAADAAPAVARHQPEQLEGLDDRLITFERERRMNPEALRLLPEGGGWLMVIFSGDTQDEADAKARALIDELHGTEHEPTVQVLRRPGAREGTGRRPRGRPWAPPPGCRTCRTPGRAGRTPRSRPSGSATTCGT